MKLFRTKTFVGIFAILLFLGFGYYYREDAGRFLRGVLSRLLPCQRPITYSIGNFDSRFGLGKTEFLNDMQKAEKIWESPINRALFVYSPTGDLKINLNYDYRQKATDAMKKIGIVVNDDRASYEALKAKYDAFIASYNKDKAQIDTMLAAYNTAKSAYEKDVAYWNSRGGAPKAEYSSLEQTRINLDNQATVITQAESSLNELVDTINSTKIVLNKLIATLNLQVKTYNTVGSSAGKVFREGEYVSDASGVAINIFEFSDANQLVRVLAHELGHALGLGHLSNPKAIMYYLNEGINEKLTADDLAALKNVCRIR